MAYPQLRASITSSITDTDGTSIVGTHPTGLTSGDLMILFVGFNDTTSGITVNTPSGWTLQASSTLNSNRKGLYCFKKIATSGDVSAGSTTITFTDTVEKSGYAMFAVTGAASGSEITLFETDLLAENVTVLTATTAITPVVSESLVFSAFFAQENSASAQITASSFSLTPSITLTERVDLGILGGGGIAMSMFVATGEYTGLTQITSRSVTISEESFENASIFFLVNAPQNATGSNALLDVSPTLFAPAVTNTNTVSNALLEVSPSLTETNASGTTPTQWTNPPKPSTTYTNTPKI